MSLEWAGDWAGVFPAATTQFRSDETLDPDATSAHFRMLIEAGVHGLIPLGTLGENTVLEPEEKMAVLRLAVEAAEGRIPILAGVAENSTRAACRFAEAAERAGCNGLMVLPAMTYKADAAEAVGHFRAVARATSLPVMIYNNPIAYHVDLRADDLAELADEATVVAIKESSDDPRRLTDLVNALGERYLLFCGVDDLALEAALLGAVGWVAGLVNAFPQESLRLWALARDGRWTEARALYRWFTPLLHLDIGPKLVQQIKLVQALAGHGSETVRLPRRQLTGDEREWVMTLVQRALETRPEADD